MARFVDDDEDVVVAKAKPEAAVAVAEEPKPAKQTAVASDDDVDEAKPKRNARVVEDDDDEDPKKGKKAQATGVEVEFGDSSNIPKKAYLERMRPEKEGEILRFSFLPHAGKPRMSLTHYIADKGTFQCLQPMNDKLKTKPYCCEKLQEKLGEKGENSLRIIALVIQYTNASPKDGSMKDKHGNPVPIEYEIKFVQLSSKNWEQIGTCYDEDGSPYDIDLRMKKNKVGYDFSRIRSKASWKQIPELAAEVEEAVKMYADGKKLAQKLGKVSTLVDYKQLLASIGAGAEDADMDNVEDV